jgi:hypothetical protein
MKEGAGRGGLLFELALFEWLGHGAARHRAQRRLCGCTWAGTHMSGWRTSKAALGRGVGSVTNGRWLGGAVSMRGASDSRASGQWLARHVAEHDGELGNEAPNRWAAWREGSD